MVKSVSVRRPSECRAMKPRYRVLGSAYPPATSRADSSRVSPLAALGVPEKPVSRAMSRTFTRWPSDRLGARPQRIFLKRQFVPPPRQLHCGTPLAKSYTLPPSSSRSARLSAPLPRAWRPWCA